MIKASSDNTDQLTTCVDRPRVWPLVIVPIPLLCTAFHLCHVVGSQGQMLKTTTSGHGTQRDEIVKGETIEGSESTPRTLDSLEDGFSRQIGPPRIIASNTGVLDIIATLESLEALRPSIVDILGVGDKLRRRRRSVGSRHFEWRMG